MTSYGYSGRQTGEITYGPQIAIVGAGPRGTSVLERISASANQFIHKDSWLTIHVIDQYPPGAGKVWRTDQSPLLVMNTLAAQTTLFTDDSVKCCGPIKNGPNLYDWLHRNEHPVDLNDYSTRVQGGTYLRWVYDHVVERLPENVRVKFHLAQAQKLCKNTEGLYKITLSTGKALDTLSAVVLAQGHLPKDLVDDDDVGEVKSRDRYAKENAITYIPPGNAANANLSSVTSTDNVLLVGMGLIFFDYMALLSEGLGGEFVRENCKLVYKCSRKEPNLYCFSRRGLPLHARATNQMKAGQLYRPQIITQECIKKFRREANDNNAATFHTGLWPLIAKEVEVVYYKQLLRLRDEADEDIEKFEKEFLNCKEDAKVALVAGWNLELWNWDHVRHPDRQFKHQTCEEWEEKMLSYLKEDVRQAQLGNIQGPHGAARSVLRDIRNELRRIIDHQGIKDDTARHLTRRFASLDGFLAVGPPLMRIEQMIALIEAGVLHVLSPKAKISNSGDGKWSVVHEYPRDTKTLQVNVLIEARVEKPKLAETTDPLLKDLYKTSQCRPHVTNGSKTGGLDITRRGHQIIADGQAPGSTKPADEEANSDDEAPTNDQVNERVFAIGVPTEGALWSTTYLPTPNAGSVALLVADTVARGALRRAQKDLIDGKVKVE
ncbi:hypothetical protein EAE96_004806 [Botrytis aclada]|nr:hypothetical protein EAE96_004806 [Botrytis aclada]